MPRLQKDLTVAIAKNLKAFFRIDLGVGRSVPESLVKERQRRTSVQDALGNDALVTASGAPRQAHALSEPDESINRRRIFHSMVSPLKPGKMLDLAAGPGNFSIPAAKLGWDVTAVDVRTVRRPDPEAESDPERARLIRSINWVESDIREFEIKRREYDLICVFGILHHLELDDQIALVKKFSGTLTILDCRIAPEVMVREGRYEGNYVREFGKTREERDKIPAASWGNERSFQHTEESLVRLLHDNGFRKVMCMTPPHAENYTFYVALPLT
jgi:SAM-dependent methyltransferase